MNNQRSWNQRIWDAILKIAKVISPGTQDPTQTGELRDVTSPAPKKKTRSHTFLVGRSRKGDPSHSGWSRKNNRPKGKAGY